MGLAGVSFLFFEVISCHEKNFIAANFATPVDRIEEKDQNETF